MQHVHECFLDDNVNAFHRFRGVNLAATTSEFLHISPQQHGSIHFCYKDLITN
jgi:hypothetical protein